MTAPTEFSANYPYKFTQFYVVYSYPQSVDNYVDN
jgi:hypothetical protein